VHELAPLVDIAAFEVLRPAAAARCAHLIAGGVEIVATDEFEGAVANHLVRIVAQDRYRTRTDADERALAIGDEDQVLRGLEDAAQRGFGGLRPALRLDNPGFVRRRTAIANEIVRFIED